MKDSGYGKVWIASKEDLEGGIEYYANPANGKVKVLRGTLNVSPYWTSTLYLSHLWYLVSGSGTFDYNSGNSSNTMGVVPMFLV